MNFRYHYAVALIESGNRAAAKQQAETALVQEASHRTGRRSLRNLLAQAK